MLQRPFILAACAPLLALPFALIRCEAIGAENAPISAVCTRSESESRLLADAQDGRLDEHSLIAAALIAGGVDDPAIARECEAKVNALASEFRASKAFDLPMAEKAAAMHQFLHARVLVGDYDVQANRIDELLRSGRFNCITASTLLLALAKECDVPAAAWEGPAHVLVVIDPNGAATPVEMTRRQWRSERLLSNETVSPSETFASDAATGTDENEAPADEEKSNGIRTDAAASTTPSDDLPVADKVATRTPPAAQPPGRLIRPTQLLATYYHNRGVERLAARDFSAAVALNQTALELDGDCPAARQNLLAAWNNWALALADAGDYAAALQKIDSGLAIAPGYEPLRENRVFIEHRRDGKQRPPRSALRAGVVASMFF